MPMLKHSQLIGKTQRLLLVMRHENARDLLARQALLDHFAHVGPQPRVERRERFVEQHQLGTARQRARECHALLLATRKLVRHARADGWVKFNRIDQCPDGPVVAAHLHAEADIGRNAEVRKQGPFLRHETDAAPVRRHHPTRSGDFGTVEHDLALIGPLEAGDQSQQCRLARPGRADDRSQSPRRDGEAGAIERRHAAIALGHAEQAQQAHARSVRSACRRSSTVSGKESRIISRAYGAAAA